MPASTSPRTASSAHRCTAVGSEARAALWKIAKFWLTLLLAAFLAALLWRLMGAP